MASKGQIYKALESLCEKWNSPLTNQAQNRSDIPIGIKFDLPEADWGALLERAKGNKAEPIEFNLPIEQYRK